ncbi:MAG: outer membrane protein transport protein [FCB group bacterium]|jgi:long-chain fatty acid transport protein
MKFKFTFSILSLFIILSVYSYSNGLSLNSIGPKALGMGGAFIGIADDYTAVYWNPAGIVNLKKAQIALFVTDDVPWSTYHYDPGYPRMGVDAKSKTNHYISPGVSGYIPFLNGDLSVGLGVFVPAGLGSEWYGGDFKLLTNGASLNWKSKIMAYSFSPVIAYKFDKMLSIGAALNIYYATMDMSQPSGSFQYTESGNGIGYSGSLGLLFNPFDMLSIGLSLKTQNTVKLKGTANTNEFYDLKIGGIDSSPYSRDLAWPTWFGAGIALRPFDGLTIAFDAQWSNWSKTEDSVLTTYNNNYWKNLGLGTQTLTLHWKDCIQYRLGVQYMTSKTMAVRAGYYYDPAPAPDETMNILFPSDTYNAVTIGCGNDFGWLNVDLGLEYLFGSKRTVPSKIFFDGNNGISGLPGDHQTNIFAFSLGFSYKFE